MITPGSRHDPRPPGLNGWIEAALFVVAVSALNVLYAYAVANGAHVVVFILYAMIGTSLLMLWMSGVGTDAFAVMTVPQSWIFGISSVALEGVYFMLVSLVSPAEASLTARLSVPASLLIGWLFFASRLTRRQFAGGLVVIAAVLPIFFAVPEERRGSVILLGIATALIVAIKTFSSEFHPWNRHAASISEKVRVTGLVVLATTLLASAATLALVAAAAVGSAYAAAIAPPPAAFLHVPTLLLAGLFGTAVLTAMSYLTFSSVVKIGTPAFLATSAVTPLTTYALQTLFAAAGIITVPSFELSILLPILAGIAGVLLIVTDDGRT